MTVKTKGQIAKEKTQAKMAELQTALESLNVDEAFQAALKLQSNILKRGHRYSLGNTLMAMVAAKKAGMSISFLGSFPFWKKISEDINKSEGNTERKSQKWYGVQKGAKGLPCLFPFQKTIKTEDKETGEEVKKKITLFGMGTVFDISQTGIDSSMLKAVYPEKVYGETQREKYEIVKSLAQRLGYTVEYEELPASTGGFIQPKTKRIVLNQKNDLDHRLKTLLHEMAHGELGHGIGGDHGIEDRDTAGFEIQAESVAFILSDMIGLDTSGYSFKYIVGWAGGDFDYIKSCMDKAHKVITKLVEELESVQVITLAA